MVTVAVQTDKRHTHGAWIQLEAKRDIHVSMENGAMVIGYNDKHGYGTKDTFTDIALVLEQDKVFLQYADKNDRVQMKDLSADEVAQEILALLNKFRDKALADK